MNQTVRYLCPKDRGPLERAAGGLSCAACGAVYGVDPDGLVHLDPIGSEQAAAFDALAARGQTLRPEEVEGSARLARRYLSLARRSGASELRTALDVAAGRGELCVGLLLAPELRNAEVHALDHSAGSLRVLMRTAAEAQVADHLRASVQDVRALAFAPESFDLITGNAVLHHFDDVKRFLEDARRLMRPGASCVFAEPFAEGYLLAMQILRRAVRAAGVPRGAPGLGLYEFIAQNVSERVRNASRPEKLAHLTDKHFFSIPRVTEWASQLGLSATFEGFEDPGYYEAFLNDILQTYQISSPPVVALAREMYREEREYVGDEFASLYSHFRFIVLTRVR